MNGRDLINVRWPVADYDAVPKIYCDRNHGTLVTLTGTTPSAIFNNLVGVIDVMIEPASAGALAPRAQATVAKSDPSKVSYATYADNRSGADGITRLRLDWSAGDGVYLSKTTATYDGTYRVFASSTCGTPPTGYDVDLVLTSTTNTPLPTTLLNGSLEAVVTAPSNPGAPVALFRMSRTILTQTVFATAMHQSHGLLNNCRLVLSWPASDVPALRKTTNDYDGTYRVRFTARTA